MTEHLSTHTIELFTGGGLSPAQLLAAANHLAACVECRQKASERADVPDRVQHLRTQLQTFSAEITHPDYEQFEAYLEDSLPLQERESLKKHFNSCSTCLKEVRELEALRDNLRTYPLVNSLPVATSAPESFRQKITNLLWTRQAQFALLSVALLLIVVFAVLLMRRQPSSLITNKNSPLPNTNEANQNNQVAGGNPNSNIEQPKPNGTGEVAAAEPYQSALKQAMETGRVNTPQAIRDLIGKDSKLLGSPSDQDRFDLVSPLGTVIRSTRPTFRWKTLSGATSYSVAILDSQLNLVEQSNPTKETNWTPLHHLKRNVVYLWQVTALKNGREIQAPAAPAKEARFKVLSGEKTTALARVATELAGSHLKLGIIYVQEGLLDDAEQEFRAAMVGGDESARARKLLQSVRQMRR